MPTPDASVAPQCDLQRGRPPAEWFVRQASHHGVARDAFAAAPATPLVGIDDPAGQQGTAGLEALPDHQEPELVEAAERGQVRAREGSVGHVEVFQMGGVRTSIFGRPRHLPWDRRADQTYTVICDEPDNPWPLG